MVIKYKLSKVDFETEVNLTVWVRHFGGPPFRGPPFMGAAIPGSPIKCLPVVILGHRATWMTKSMLLNYATDYQKSEALI